MVWQERVIGGKLVGEEERAMNGVLWGRFDGIKGKNKAYYDERVRPSVSKREVLPAAEV